MLRNPGHCLPDPGRQLKSAATRQADKCMLHRQLHQRQHPPEAQEVVDAAAGPLPGVEAGDGELRHQLDPLLVALQPHLRCMGSTGQYMAIQAGRWGGITEGRGRTRRSMPRNRCSCCSSSCSKDSQRQRLGRLASAARGQPAAARYPPALTAGSWPSGGPAACRTRDSWRGGPAPPAGAAGHGCR